MSNDNILMWGYVKCSILAGIVLTSVNITSLTGCLPTVFEFLVLYVQHIHFPKLYLFLRGVWLLILVSYRIFAVLSVLSIITPSFDLLISF